MLPEKTVVMVEKADASHMSLCEIGGVTNVMCCREWKLRVMYLHEYFSYKGSKKGFLLIIVRWLCDIQRKKK